MVPGDFLKDDMQFGLFMHNPCPFIVGMDRGWVWGLSMLHFHLTNWFCFLTVIFMFARLQKNEGNSGVCGIENQASKRQKLDGGLLHRVCTLLFVCLYYRSIILVDHGVSSTLLIYWTCPRMIFWFIEFALQADEQRLNRTMWFLNTLILFGMFVQSLINALSWFLCLHWWLIIILSYLSEGTFWLLCSVIVILLRCMQVLLSIWFLV